jgi:predicted DNA-binding transcriptional regulator YafY
MGNAEILLAAIEQRRAISFRYRDEERAADPYILGHDAKGHLMLSAVQWSGGSGRGFRTFKVDEISDLRPLSRHFRGTDPDYRPTDAYFESVLARV